MKIFKRINYWRGKIYLAARFPFFSIALIILSIGLPLKIHASRNITPATVSVSGYYRSDSIYVNSYRRRPPYSRRHDEPYETLNMIALFLIATGSIGIIAFFYRLCILADMDLLPMPLGLIELPKRKYVGRLSKKAKIKYNEAMNKQQLREKETFIKNKIIIAEQFKKYYGIYPEEKEILFCSKKT